MNTDNISEREGLERLESLAREKNYKEASAFASDLREKYSSSFQIGFLYYGILVKLEKYSESENVLDDLLKLYPENFNILLEKGELLINRGKTAESKLFFEKVLFLDPFNDKAKLGLERVKSMESGSSDEGTEKKPGGNPVLDDTMKESDLERFMSEDGVTADNFVEDGEEELDISLSESGLGFDTNLESIETPVANDDENKMPFDEEESEIRPSSKDTVKTVDIGSSMETKNEAVEEKDDNTAIPVSDSSVSGKVENALMELDKFSASDIQELGLDENSEDEEKPVENTEGSSDSDAFVTESAAHLYLKQGLYEDAKNVYSKLYKGSNIDLFNKKIDKVKRIEKANLKIIALEGFLERIRTGSVRIV